MIFNQQLGDAANLVRMAESMQASLIHAMDKQGLRKSSVSQEARWQAPQYGWVKISYDGATNRVEDWATTAGVIRDHKAAWVADF